MIYYMLKEYNKMKHFNFKLFNKSIISYYYSDKFGWIRLFNICLIVKHIKHGLLFSERNNIRKYLKTSLKIHSNI